MEDVAAEEAHALVAGFKLSEADRAGAEGVVVGGLELGAARRRGAVAAREAGSFELGLDLRVVQDVDGNISFDGSSGEALQGFEDARRLARRVRDARVREGLAEVAERAAPQRFHRHYDNDASS